MASNVPHSASETLASPTRPLSPLPAPSEKKKDEIFEEARSSFLDLVPEAERAQFSDCCDAANLVNQIRSIVDQNPALGQAAHQCVHKVANFTKKISGTSMLFTF
jgi:hypothetical protein